MESEQQAVKMRILDAAIELIQEVQAFEKVSMRKIAERAGVAVSMVNYHFQTKDNLINRAVQSYVGTVISGSADDSEESHTGDPVDRMRAHLKQAASFIADHPGISRVSILRDMQGGGGDDNTSQVEAMVEGQLTEVDPERSGSSEVRLRAMVQVAAVQHLFLRSELVKEKLGLDFFDPEERDQLMDMLIDTVTGGKSAGPADSAVK